MVLAVTLPGRRIPQPPQPVDTDSPLWVARAWQWVFDRLTHLDECMDETKDSVKEQHIELSAWMTASKDSDANIMARVQTHIDEHEKIGQIQAGRKGVLKLQSDLAKQTAAGIVELVKLGGAVYLLKLLGVIGG